VATILMIFLRVLSKNFLWPHYSAAAGARGPRFIEPPEPPVPTPLGVMTLSWRCYTVQCARLARTEKTAVGSLRSAHCSASSPTQCTCNCHLCHVRVLVRLRCIRRNMHAICCVAAVTSTCSVDGLKTRLHFIWVYSDFNRAHTFWAIYKFHIIIIIIIIKTIY